MPDSDASAVINERADDALLFQVKFVLPSRISGGEPHFIVNILFLHAVTPHTLNSRIDSNSSVSLSISFSV